MGQRALKPNVIDANFAQILNVYEWVVVDKRFGKQNSSTGTATEIIESVGELGIFSKTQILVW